jgi:hypothetical protein
MMMNFADRLIEGDPSALLVQDIFGPDITLSRFRCLGCDSVRGVGSLSLQSTPIGAVLQCPQCNGVVMRAIHVPRGMRFEITCRWCRL